MTLESPEIVELKVKGLLNKLTMEEFDSISDQIIAWANKSENEKDGRTLYQIMRLVFEKATEDAASSEMYARLCRKMMERISNRVRDDGGTKGKGGAPMTGGRLFCKYLLNRCQEDFERGWVAKDATAAAAARRPGQDEAIKAGNEKKEGGEEYYAAQKAKRQGLRLIKFIGELFKLYMLTELIMHKCVKKLLGNIDNPEEEEIESLCTLLATVGEMLDTQKARAYMDVYFSRMKELKRSSNVSSRMQSMLQNVIELREYRWLNWDQLVTVDTETIWRLLQRNAPWRGIEGVPKALAGALLDELQSELDGPNMGDLNYQTKCIKCVRALSKQYSIIPSKVYIPSAHLKHDNVIHAGGAFSDICRGTMKGQGTVCFKILRIQSIEKLHLERMMKDFCHEALIWSQLRHENVLPCYGVSTEIFPSRLCLISPWMGNGNILKFLETNPSHDRRGCVWDIAAGMQYLHNLDPCIIHKDIRGANILVGDDFRCYLTDFGISLVVETEIPGTSTRNQGNIRWLPPELIEESEFDPYLMREIDVYSFGCTLIEIYTGRPPYSNLRTEGAVVSHIISRRPPLQPPTDILPSNVWDTVVVPCLAPIPKDRPSAENILDALWTLHSEYLGQNLAARGAAYVRTSET